MLHFGVKVVARRRCLAAVRLQARVLSAEVHAPSKQPPTQKQPLVVRQYAVERNGEIRTTTYEAVPGSPGGFNKLEDVKKRRRRSWEALVEETQQAGVRALLPRGYPYSVHPGYLSYVKLQMTASLASSATGVLSTQALLYAMGLGAGAIPLAAALNWVIKDGVGQIGGIVFASVVNDRFDANPKRWKMVSCIAMDASCLLELMAPLAPAYFLAIASLANVGKNVCFLSASASRAAIHNAFAKRENLADITAKSGSQFIVTSILGTGLGILLSSTLGHSWSALAPIFAVLSCVNITSNYLSLRHVCINTINMERLELILENYAANGRVLSPSAISPLERFLSPPLADEAGSPTAAMSGLPPMQVGRPVELVATPEQLPQLAALFQGDKYILSVRGDPAQRTAVVDLLIKREATVDNVLMGWLHAYFARKEAKERGWKSPPLSLLAQPKLDGAYTELLVGVIDASRAKIGTGEDFLHQVKAAGWLTDSVFLPFADHRVSFAHEH